MDIREYLRNKGINWKEVSRPSGTQAIFNCPRCDDNKQKFAINLDSGAYQCFRKNECGISGSWWDFQKLYNDKPLPLDSDRNFIRKEKKYKKPQIKSDPRNDKLYEFFNKRKIKKDTVNYFKIGIKNQAIAIPHFFDKELIFVKYRSLEDKKFWNEEGCKPILFNMDNCINENTLRIFEGQFDVMAAHEYDLAGVSVPNGVSDLSWIENCWDFIDNFKYIYLFFDNDNAGQAAVKSIVNRLGSWRCYNVLLPEKDINDCLVKSIKSEKIYEAEKNAKEFDHYILKKANDFREDVKNHNKNYEKRYGYDIGFRGLNYILKGLREE